MLSLANIEGDEIVIRVPLDALKVGAPIAWDRHYGENRLCVEDEAEFAKEFALALNDENEIGETLVHAMLDKAAVNLVESGSPSVAEDAQ